MSPLRSAGGLQGSTLCPPGVCLRGCAGALHPRRQREQQAACPSGLTRRSTCLGVRAARARLRQAQMEPRSPMSTKLGTAKMLGATQGARVGKVRRQPSPPAPPDLLPELSTGLLEATVTRNGGVQAPVWKVSFPLSKTKDLKQTRPVESFLSKPASQRGILIQPSASSTSCPPGSRMQKSQRQREPHGSGNLGSRAKDPPPPDASWTHAARNHPEKESRSAALALG